MFSEGLADIAAHGHYHSVENPQGTLDDIEVAEGERIERARE